MRTLTILCIVTVLLTGMLTGCGTPQSSTDNLQRQKTETLMAEADRQTGLPNITNFQQKKLMKLIYELCDSENLICYAYLKSDYTGKLIYVGKCIGYGIPFSAQYTNPKKIAAKKHDYGYAILPQADPNGLFMPTSSSATWLMMIDKDGKERPVYFEPEIVVSPFPLN